MTSSDDLEARRTVLEDQIDSLGSQMIGFTWLVAVGLFIEFYAVFGLDVTRDWNTLIDRIGLFLVTIGVAGELNVEHRARKAERQLRRVNADIDLKVKAELKAKDERVAELGRDTALALERAEEERLARIEIEERIQPRRLNLKQQKEIAEQLRRFTVGTIRKIFVGTTDVESYGLAFQIVACLRFAGLVVADIHYDLAHIAVQPTPESGVEIIQYHPEDEALADTLEAALTSIGGVSNVKLIRAYKKYPPRVDDPWPGLRVIIEPKAIPLIYAVGTIQE